MLRIIAEREIEKVIPERCGDCPKPQGKCMVLAMRVVSELIDIEEAKAILKSDLDNNCPRGEFSRSTGWASLQPACSYTAPTTLAD